MAFLRLRLGQGLGLSACRRDFLEAPCVYREDDTFIWSPTRSEGVADGAQGDGGASSKGYFLQIAAGEETDPSTIWREERMVSILGSFYGSRFGLIHGSVKDLHHAAPVGTVNQVLSVWRKSMMASGTTSLQAFIGI